MTHRPTVLLENPEATARADLLSDVLKAIRLSGSLFFLMESEKPFDDAARVPEGAALAPVLTPRAQNVLSFHVAMKGECWAGLAGQAPVPIAEGDVVVFPHGDAYYLGGRQQVAPPADVSQSLQYLAAHQQGLMPFLISRGGRCDVRLACGFLGCDLTPFNPLVETLPRMLVIRRESRRPDRLDAMLELVLEESRRPQPGGANMRLRLSELLFVEVVRRHFENADETVTGWLAAARDEVVGRALTLLHAKPAQSWSLAELAKKSGASRSVLAERFTRLLGVPPMQYLARWRMQVAAHRLAETRTKVSAVALEVGYDSEAAFSRAFKKTTGVTPAAWRERNAA
jgi:AraC-like DNA-binding protein